MRKLGLLAAAALVAAPIAFMATLPAQANGTMGNDYMIRFVNSSDVPIYELYLVNVDYLQGWGDNLLDLFGINAIYPGEAYWIDVDDYYGYCMYDMYAVGGRNTEWEEYYVNVCELENWELY